MAIGRKEDKKKAKAPTIIAPPEVKRSEFYSPLGDQYVTRREGSTEISEAFLSPHSQFAIQSGKDALASLVQELHTPDNRRIEDIARKSRDFYDLHAGAIHAEADNMLEKGKSDLARRFGGAYNATFGTDYLARLQDNRLGELSNAAKEAVMFGEDLYQRDEDSRMARFNLFNNFLTNEHNKALGVAQDASQMLQNDAQRAQDLAIQRAQMLQDAQRYNQQLEIARRQQSLNLVNTMGPMLIGAMFPSSKKSGGASASSIMSLTRLLGGA